MLVNPFSMAYVLKTTAKHIRRCIDISIRKTSARWEDFPNDPEKQREITLTLMRLHDLRALLDNYQRTHSEEFTDNGGKEQKQSDD